MRSFETSPNYLGIQEYEFLNRFYVRVKDSSAIIGDYSSILLPSRKKTEATPHRHEHAEETPRNTQHHIKFHQYHLHHDRSIIQSPTKFLLWIGHAPGGGRALQQEHCDASLQQNERGHCHHIIVLFAVEVEDRLLAIAAQKTLLEEILSLWCR